MSSKNKDCNNCEILKKNLEFNKKFTKNIIQKHQQLIHEQEFILEIIDTNSSIESLNVINTTQLDYLKSIFDTLPFRDKVDFMKVNFTHDYVSELSITVKNNLLVALLNYITLNPIQVLDQMKRWETNNPMNRKKMVEYLQTFLTPTEIKEIAK
jgi:hypothetical protein